MERTVLCSTAKKSGQCLLGVDAVEKLPRMAVVRNNKIIRSDLLNKLAIRGFCPENNIALRTLQNLFSIASVKSGVVFEDHMSAFASCGQPMAIP